MLPSRHHSVELARCLLAWSLGILVPGLAAAQPQVGNIVPRALSTGEAATVVVEGAGFDASCRLLSELSLEQQLVSSEPGRLVFQVRATGAPGWYPLWIHNDAGISSATLVAVDAIATVPATTPITTLPVAVFGEVRGDQISRLEVPLLAGQRVALDVQARRLGAAWQPVLRVFDPSGRQVAAARPDPRLEGDGATEFIATVQGVYRIELQDQLRRGANPAFFRLVLGDLHATASVYPAARDRSEAAVPVQAIGVQAVAELQLPGSHRTVGWNPVPLPTAGNQIGPAPGYLVAEGGVQVEREGNEPSTLPVALAGQFQSAGEIDRWRVRVTPGSRLAVNVWSSRLAMATDPVVEVATLDGAVLGRVDDVPGTKDPLLEVAVPGDREELEIRVRDLVSALGSTYLLEVFDPARPQLSGRLERDSLGVPPGGAAMVVPIDRQKFPGEVRIELDPPIAGLVLSGEQVPSGADRAVLRLQPSAEGFQPQVTRLRLTAADESVASTHASRPLDPLTRTRSWLAEPIAISPVRTPRLEVSVPQLTSDSVLWSGGSVPISVTVQRSPGIDGPIRVSLLTQQAMPRKRIKEGDAEKEVDAVEQTLRFESAVTVPAGSDRAEAILVVPTSLPRRAWGLVVVAEALGADGSSVMAAAVSPIVMPQVREGLVAMLEGSDPIPLKAGAAEPLVVRGRIQRDANLSGPIVVSMIGLPDSIAIPEVNVEDASGAFELTLSIPEGVTLEQMGAVKVTATVWSESGLPLAEIEPIAVPFIAP